MSSERSLPFQYQFAAGAIAGISEILVMYPLDVLKTRMQLQNSQNFQSVSYNGMLDCFNKIIRTEGFSRLYRGIEAPIFMEAPKRAMKFAANDFWGNFFREFLNVSKMNQPLSILAGATAGASEAFVVVPFDLIKIRMQDHASAAKYMGVTDCLIKIIKNEGLLSLYNGLESTLWRHALWNSGYFGCIYQIREILPRSDIKKIQVINDLVSGAIGGIVGTILNTPMDVIKSRIQNSPKVSKTVSKYKWAWPALRIVYKEEGFRALYKGFTPKVIRLGPGGGLLLVVFTGVTDFFKKYTVEL